MRAEFCSPVMALSLLVATAAPSYAQTDWEDLHRALQTIELPELRRLQGEASEPMQRDVAAGAMAAFANRGAQAETALSAVIPVESVPDELRADAASVLSGVFLRRGRFAEALAAMEAERRLRGGVFAEPEQARSFAFAQALAAAEPMRAVTPDRGEVSIRRDRARLPRASVTVNGHEIAAVLDTGASYSTVMESEARDRGIRLLSDSVAVGTATGEVTARLGVADRLDFAGAQFSDVVFIVLPDEALTFAGGLYRIPMILGLPVLIDLGRLQFTFGRREGMLRYARGGASAGEGSNLILNGAQPLVLVSVNGVGLRLLLDTGARSTFLSRAVLDAAPGLVDGAERRATTIIGAGGAERDPDALRIERLTIEVSGHSVPLSNVSIIGEARGRSHGVLGQDVLLSGAGYVVDFEAMRVEILP